MPVKTDVSLWLQAEQPRDLRDRNLHTCVALSICAPHFGTSLLTWGLMEASDDVFVGS